MYKTRNRKQAPAVRGTLDQKHNEKMSNFDSKASSLPQIRCRLLSLKEELKALQNMPPDMYTKASIRRKTEVMDQIQKLEEEIRSTENCTDQLNYMTSTFGVLKDYYSNDSTESSFDTSNIDKRNVLSYLVPATAPRIASDKMNKSQLYNKYLAITDHRCQKDGEEDVICDCGGTMRPIITEGRIECEVCGLSEVVLPTTEKPSYNEPIIDTNNYTYKRRNHLQEILSQLQAKESTEIPKYVENNILQYCEARGIDVEDLDYCQLRKIMKRLALPNKFQEHAPFILQKLNGKEPPVFSREIEAKIKDMFDAIQIPFATHCPANRKNFLNYSYVLHKFCELLELDEFIYYFPLLKNNQKLAQHDKIWKNICRDMRWQFIKSL